MKPLGRACPNFLCYWRRPKPPRFGRRKPHHKQDETSQGRQIAKRQWMLEYKEGLC